MKEKNKYNNYIDSTHVHNMIGESPYRFVIIILFCLLNFSSGLQWVTFASVADKFKQFYNLNQFSIDLFSLIFMIIYPFFNFPASYLIDNKNLRLGLSIAAGGTFLGAVFKSQLNNGIAFAYIGQIISAIVQPLILNSPGKLASTWFRDERRVIVTSMCCVSNIIGVITGFLLPNIFVNSMMGEKEYKDNIEKYLYTEMIINGIFCLPTLILMKSKPSIPPSNSQNNYQSPPIIDCIKILFKNKSFILLLINFTFIMGYFNLYGTVSNSLYSMYKLNDDYISYVVGTANIAGILSSLLVSAIVDKYKNYKQIFIILNIIGIIFHGICTLFIELFEDYTFIILIVCSTFCYCCILPIYTCSMDFVCELTYPVGETISGGIIMTFTQISGIIIILLSDYFMSAFPDKRYLTNLAALIFISGSLIAIILLEVKLIRHEKDLETIDEEKVERLIS